MSSSASAASTYFLPFCNYISSFHRHIILILCLLSVFLFLAMFYYQNRRYLIDDIRHQKSIDETYYILDSFTLWDPHPAFQIIGNTGNLYDVYFGPSTIKCSCPDRKSPCKHIIFLLTLLGVDPKPGYLSVDILYCIQQIHDRRPFKPHMLIRRANQLCLSFIYKHCWICHKGVDRDGYSYVCDKCELLTHASHSNNGKDAAHSNTMKDRCPVCNCNWHPYHSSKVGIYHNFSAMLNRLGIPVEVSKQDHPPKHLVAPDQFIHYNLPSQPIDTGCSCHNKRQCKRRNIPDQKNLSATFATMNVVPNSPGSIRDV